MVVVVFRLMYQALGRHEFWLYGFDQDGVA